MAKQVTLQQMRDCCVHSPSSFTQSRLPKLQPSHHFMSRFVHPTHFTCLNVSTSPMHHLAFSHLTLPHLASLYVPCIFLTSYPAPHLFCPLFLSHFPVSLTPSTHSRLPPHLTSNLYRNGCSFYLSAAFLPFKLPFYWQEDLKW